MKNLTPMLFIAGVISSCQIDTNDPVIKLDANHAALRLHAEAFDYVSSFLGPHEIALRMECANLAVPVEIMQRLEISESGGDSQAENHNGGTVDKGKYQVRMRFVQYYGWRFGIPNFDPRDDVQSAIFAVRYMRYLYDLSGDWMISVMMYKCGPNNWQQPYISLWNKARDIARRGR